MTVVDASVIVDSLVVIAPAGDWARSELARLAVLQVPAIFGAEATSGLRALVLRGELSTRRAATALHQLRETRTLQYPFEPFALRVWELRENLSVYDAWYIALAEWLRTEFVTTDARLASAPGPRCQIRMLGS